MFSRDHFNVNGSYMQNSSSGPLPGKRLTSENNFQRHRFNSTNGYNNQFAGYPARQMQNTLVPRTPNTSRFLQVSHENNNLAYNRPSTSKSGFQCQEQNNMSALTNRTYQSPHQNVNANSLGLMGMPKPSRYSQAQSNAASNRLFTDVSLNLDGRLKMRKSGETEKEKLCILTGTVERVIKYGKIFQSHFCYFQVIGSVVSIADGKVQFERIMLLRDKKGPILQLTYYSNATHINIEDFHLGQNLRAVGRMVGPNVMSAITIRAATDEELDILPRMCYISDYAVSTLCGDGEIPYKAA